MKFAFYIHFPVSTETKRVRLGYSYTLQAAQHCIYIVVSVLTPYPDSLLVESLVLKLLWFLPNTRMRVYLALAKTQSRHQTISWSALLMWQKLATEPSQSTPYTSYQEYSPFSYLVSGQCCPGYQTHYGAILYQNDTAPVWTLWLELHWRQLIHGWQLPWLAMAMAGSGIGWQWPWLAVAITGSGWKNIVLSSG